MSRHLIVIACVFGLLAVVTGAFGAHGLKNRLAPELMSAYQTGVQYHFYHALALLACGILMRTGMDNSAMRMSAYAFIAGMVLFSGSLYLLAITGVRWLGAITPLGGVAFIAGWLFLMLGVLRSAG
jgi:uncharacterized membrane protein YgdD (TMEM256/DUF423 family)